MLTPKIFTHTPKFNPEPVIFFGVIFGRLGGGFFNHHKKGGWDARVSPKYYNTICSCLQYKCYPILRLKTKD